MKRPLYCISGLGADERVFANLQIKGYELHHIPWLVPEKNESIEKYAARMAAYFKHESPVLIGVSFGGMIGIEIARQIPLKKLIIISSIKTKNEMPGWMKIIGRMKLNKLVPFQSYKLAGSIENRRLGISNEEERKMVRAYRRKADPIYVTWAVDKVLNWKNDWQPEHLVHIHGDKDRIFPIQKISPSHIIKDGTHLMIYNRAREIGEFLERELQVSDFHS